MRLEIRNPFTSTKSDKPKEPKQKISRRKKIILVIIVILVILVAVRVGSSLGKAAQQRAAELNRVSYTPVEALTVEKQAISSTITLSGKVQADKEAPVMVKTPGKVTAVHVKVGDAVQKDQVLFSLDKSDMLASYNQALAGYQLAEAAYRTNMANYQKSVENLERMKELYELGAISKLELEQAEMAASESVRQTYESQFAQAKAGFEAAKKSFDDLDVKSPIDGILTELDVVVGAIATNAMPAGKVVDLSQLYVTVSVSENEINNLKKGQEVEVTVPSASLTLKGVIDGLSVAANAQGKYSIKTNLENKDGLIKPGMFANVTLNTASKENVLAVPTDAVIYRGGRNVVYVVENNKAVEKEVQTGLENGKLTEILSGLDAGATLIVEGQHFVKDGSDVKIVTLNGAPAEGGAEE